MSIIYEAIKKLENKDKSKLPGKSKKNIFLLVLLLVSISIFVFGIQYSKNKVVSLSSITNIIKGLLDQETNIKEAKGPMPKADLIAERDAVDSKEDLSSNYVLEGIIYDHLAPLAIINGKIFKKYDKIDDLAVINITPNSVELLNSKNNTILTLVL